jgi:hypothetical protein
MAPAGPGTQALHLNTWLAAAAPSTLSMLSTGSEANLHRCHPYATQSAPLPSPFRRTTGERSGRAVGTRSALSDCTAAPSSRARERGSRGSRGTTSPAGAAGRSSEQSGATVVVGPAAGGAGGACAAAGWPLTRSAALLGKLI